MEPIINLLFEAGMLAKTSRSGFAFLGSGNQTVADHSFRTALVAYALASRCKQKVDLHKLVMISLLHDLPEARIGDLNYVQKQYVTGNLNKVLDEMRSSSSLGPQIVEWIEEYERGETIEAKLAHDSDQLELLLVLKEQEELGNPRAAEWMANLQKRLKTEEGIAMGETILNTPSDAWWWKDKNSTHWIDGGKNQGYTHRDSKADFRLGQSPGVEKS